ncbi:family 78 glycoside hydrolase catalytic domain [Ruania zhangjianzhongii]|uniref:family 78 glycoside hydrolase catalytic domain n=1 Tax=Ruania zhangjianzhongii TaxID=2603206 RepID=UPI0011C969C6|nr:family 78 glycoside hydrolase catalytic domain [Ruania zhangjianzhongii]
MLSAVNGAPHGLRLERIADATCLGTATPLLSWVTPPHKDDQQAVEVQWVDAAPGSAERSWRIETAASVFVPWPGDPLRSGQRGQVRIRTEHDGVVSPWSDPVRVHVAPLGPDDWTGRFITPARGGGLDDPAPVLTAAVTVGEDLVHARLLLSALGAVRMRMNGHRVGADVLTPGWTSYAHRVRFHGYDVTDLLTAGSNDLQATLGNGWYRGALTSTLRRDLYGPELALLVQLELSYADGRTEVIGSDETWRAHTGPVRADDLYGGQHTDLRRREPDGPGDAVHPLEVDLNRLVGPEGPPPRVTERIPARSITPRGQGRHLADFGQNVVGWVHLAGVPADSGTGTGTGAGAGAGTGTAAGTGTGTAAGETPGTSPATPDQGAATTQTPSAVVQVRHAEVLADGELCTRPLRQAAATDTYELPSGRSDLSPEFTVHGFRYAEITGVEELTAEQVTAEVVGSDLRRIGWFGCSEPLLNQLHENIVWSARGNFLDVPTDCPQRDERLGWTGDIHVFARTASFLYDVDGFLASWLQDLAADQHGDGGVPVVIPDVFRDGNTLATAWADAAVVVPWVLYERFGDHDVLARQLPSMRAWVDRMAAELDEDGLWTTGEQYGDWLDPTAPPDDPFASAADTHVVQQAHLVRSAVLVGHALRRLGHGALADHYEDLADTARAAFQTHYVTGAGIVRSDCQTVYALAIRFKLLATAEQQRFAGERLAELVREAGGTVRTGFVGTPVVLDALAQAGHANLAQEMLLTTECPSWLYPVTMGATTIWERWDSMLPDGTVNPGEMTSFNHYALGAVGDFLHRRIAGLAPLGPGYRVVEVNPIIDGPITSAWATHESPYGTVRVAWERDDDGVTHLEVDLPAGVTARVFPPSNRAGAPKGRSRGAVTVGAGTHTFTG